MTDHVERWFSRIPGVGTYRDRGNRRETDKKIRRHVADGLQEMRAQLKRVMLDFSRNGKSEILIELDHLTKIGEIIPALSVEEWRRKIHEGGAVVVSLQEKHRRRKDFMGRRA